MKLSLLKSVAVAALMAHPTTAAFTAEFAKEEDLDAFLAKDEKVRDTEISTFAKAKKMPDPTEPDEDDAAAAAVKKAAALAAGAGNDDLPAGDALAKALTEHPLFKKLVETNETLTKQVTELSNGTTTATLEKRADTEFKNLGFEKTKVVSLLKAVAALPDEERTVVEDLMKAHAELTERVSRSLGVVDLVAQEGTASAKLQKLAIAKAADEKISLEAAVRKISEDPEHAALIASVDAEEQLANAA